MTVTSERKTGVAAELRHIDKWYGEHQVLRDVSLTVGAGEIVALVGRSGSGKSTVLRVLAGLSQDHTGERLVTGPPALAFQEPRLFPWRTVRTNVGYGLTRSRLPRNEVTTRADKALADVGLADRAGSWPLTLSGGQAQRVSLARALVAQPQLLLLDEPFGALDALTRLSMHALLLQLWRIHGFGVLLVTHDVNEAVALADRVLVLESGEVVFETRDHRSASATGWHYGVGRTSPGRVARATRRTTLTGVTLYSRLFRRFMVLLAVFGLLLTGCVSRQQNTGASQAPSTVPLSDLSGLVLQVGDQKGGTESLLRAAGALDNLPYQIAFSTFTSGPPQVEAATAGKIDFAITGNTPPIFGAASNAKVKVVSAYNGGGVGDAILVPADSPIQSVSDLRGKSILVGKGSSGHGNVLGQLDKAGLTTADVKLVFLQPADALSAFRAGQGDAWAIWDPLPRRPSSSSRSGRSLRPRA